MTMMLTAKISGIMPAELTFNGMNDAVAAVLLIAANTLGVVNRNSSLALVDVDDADHGAQGDQREEDGANDVLLSRIRQ